MADATKLRKKYNTGLTFFHIKRGENLDEALANPNRPKVSIFHAKNKKDHKKKAMKFQKLHKGK